MKIQMQRLEISTWLKELTEKDGICPFCNNEHVGAIDELNTLCKAISEIEKSTENIKTMPAAFERELQLVKNDIDIFTEKLNAVQKRLSEESGTLVQHSDKKYTLSGIRVFWDAWKLVCKHSTKLAKMVNLKIKYQFYQKRLICYPLLLTSLKYERNKMQQLDM